MSETVFLNTTRSPLINELHSRPFIGMTPNSRVIYINIQHDPDTPIEDSQAQLKNLTKNWGVEIPREARSFFFHDFDDFTLKWERHTEFSSYLIYQNNPKGADFDSNAFDIFPSAWLEVNKERILSSAIIEIANVSKDLAKTMDRHRKKFVPESFAAAQVLEGMAAIGTDFQIDPNGHIRFILFPSDGVGEKRIGRIVQRLVEIETYVVASMLGLPLARAIARDLPTYEIEFLPIIGGISSEKETAESSLHALLHMASRIEETISETSFRFGATAAYADLVAQRIAILREERCANYQLFSEFMMRRYEPGMRTVTSTWQRLQEFSKRLERAATFLRTKVDVSNADGQRELLASMNQRAEAQYRLQETVEGLSVVAISYYAVSLAGYLLAPLAKTLGIDKTWLLALSVPPVVLLVWLFIHGIKKHVVKKD